MPEVEPSGHRGRTVQPTGAVPAMKPEATAIGDPQDGRWKITLIFMGAGFAYRNLCILRYSVTSLVISDHVLLRRNQSRTTCFAVIG